MKDRYKGQRHVRGTSIADPDHFDTGSAFHFETYLDPTFYVDTDPDPYCFKEIMYL
jgi:hypothetical protein